MTLTDEGIGELIDALEEAIVYGDDNKIDKSLLRDEQNCLEELLIRRKEVKMLCEEKTGICGTCYDLLDDEDKQLEINRLRKELAEKDEQIKEWQENMVRKTIAEDTILARMENYARNNQAMIKNMDMENK